MKKITLKTYSLLNEIDRKLYDAIINVSKGRQFVEYYNGNNWQTKRAKHSDLWDYSWREMMAIKDAVNNSNIKDLARLVYGVSDIENVNVVDAFNSFDWITEQIKVILKTEHQELSTDDVNSDLYKPLQRFGEFPLILSIMETLKITEKEALALPYHKVFMILCYQKTFSEIEKARIKNDSRAV